MSGTTAGLPAERALPGRSTSPGAPAHCAGSGALLHPARPPPPIVQVLVAQLGPDWQSKLAEFDFQPLAAASIGQVSRRV